MHDNEELTNLNDHFRRSLGEPGDYVQSRGINRLSSYDQSQIRTLVREFNAHETENHDYGVFTYKEIRVVWEILHKDPSLLHTVNLADVGDLNRVLSIRLADEPGPPIKPVQSAEQELVHARSFNQLVAIDDSSENNTQDYIAGLQSVLFWVLKHSPGNQREFDLLADVASYFKGNLGGSVDKPNLGIPQDMHYRLLQHDYFVPIRAAIEDRQKTKANYFIALFCMSLFDKERNKLEECCNNFDSKKCEQHVLNWLVKISDKKVEPRNGGIVVHYPFEQNRPATRTSRNPSDDNVLFIPNNDFNNERN